MVMLEINLHNILFVICCYEKLKQIQLTPRHVSGLYYLIHNIISLTNILNHTEAFSNKSLVGKKFRILFIF